MEERAPRSYVAVGVQPPPQPREQPPRPLQSGTPFGQQQHSPQHSPVYGEQRGYAMYYEPRADGAQVMPWGDTLSRATGGWAPQVPPSPEQG